MTTRRYVLKPPDKDGGVQLLADDRYRLERDFTLEAWVKPTNLGKKDTGILACIYPTSVSSDAARGWALLLDRDLLQLRLLRGADIQVFSTTAPIARDVWQHVAATWDGQQALLYVDGQARPVTAATLPGARVSGGSVRLAEYKVQGTTSQLKGRLAEARIWSAVRTREQITGAMFCPPNGDGDDDGATLVGYWPLDDGDGSTRARDLSASRHDGVALASGWVMEEEFPSREPAIAVRAGASQIPDQGEHSIAVNVAVGQAATAVLLIENQGACRLRVDRIALVDNAAGFSLAGLPPLPVIIAPGGSLALAVNHTTASAGKSSARLEITSNDPTHPTFRLTLSDTAVAPAAALGLAQCVSDAVKQRIPPEQLRFPPAELKLGPSYVVTPPHDSWPLMDQGRGHRIWAEFVIYNPGDRDVTIYDVTVTPPTGTGFRARHSIPRAGKVLRPYRNGADRIVFTVENEILDPASPGARDRATLAIESNKKPYYEFEIRYGN